MEYFGSAVLMVAVFSFLVVLVDSPKIIGPSLSFCITTSGVPILADSPKIIAPSLSFCITTSAVPILIMSFLSFFYLPQAYAPLPDWSALEVEWSGNPVGCVPDDRIEQCLIGLVLVALTCQKRMFGVPHKQGTVASQMNMVACPTFDLDHMVEACMCTDMA
jgi:hypothetical protein